MFKILSQWLLPYHCILCQHKSDQIRDLCENCQSSLPYLGNCCKCCAHPLPEGDCCGRCLTSAPPFDHTVALLRYEDPIKQWISRLKFYRDLRYTRLLGELFAEHVKNFSTKPKLLIPVPLHKKRLRQRGYNQALEIARPIAKALNIPIEKHHCQRIRHTQAQSSIPAKKRRDNVKNAFHFKNQAPKHVAIIDDVLTTGHTVSELSRALRLAGSERIDVWAIARASKH